jgi:hypothetical protein
VKPYFGEACRLSHDVSKILMKVKVVFSETSVHLYKTPRSHIYEASDTETEDLLTSSICSRFQKGLYLMEFKLSSSSISK